MNFNNNQASSNFTATTSWYTHIFHINAKNFKKLWIQNSFDWKVLEIYKILAYIIK